ncbi:hypothetical protein NLI96_g13289 [Meripilus lineatus]|uniref:DSBA-like thioredoxin domain-containing protein n=1 Tax=Meripilus lineatus TaxID=2056292 RepID=A0AAD5Y6W0_9APHY|nr:hypothetical protein NLI96_g13289 [Physisporinus lineatus]
MVVTFDFVCPWSYIGINRLLRTLDSLSSDFEWDIKWRSREINPTLPAAGVDRIAYRREKYGEQRGRMLDAQVEAQARYDGLRLNMNSIRTQASSHLAHQLRVLARKRNREQQFVMAVFKGYFESAVNIGEADELVQIAASVHMDPVEVRNYLAERMRGGTSLSTSQEDNVDGIHAVPHVQIGELSVVGVRPARELREFLVRATHSDLPPPGQGFCAPDDEDCPSSPM